MNRVNLRRICLMNVCLLDFYHKKVKLKIAPLNSKKNKRNLY